MRRREYVLAIESQVRSLGLAFAPFACAASTTLLCGRVEDLVLCLAIEFSVRRASHVTASWFLGSTMRWAYRPRGVASTAYVRVAELLDLREREALCGPEESIVEGSSDYWWSPADAGSAERMSKVILITHARFLSRAPLDAIRRSREWSERKAMCRNIAALVEVTPSLEDLRQHDALAQWVTAAEQVLGPSSEKQHPRARDGAAELAKEASVTAALGVL